MRQIFKECSIKESYERRREVADAVYLAGGSGVLALKSPVKPDCPLVDISALVPKDIVKKDGRLVIGAGATFQDVIDSALVPSWLKDACHLMASMSLRMQATVAGNVASLRDDSYLIPALLAGDTVLHVYGEEGEKDVPLADYVHRGGCSCIILALSIDDGCKVGIHRIARSSSSHSAVNVAVGTHGVFACVKGSGFAFDEDDLGKMEYVDDITGTAAYKRYVARECVDLLKEVDG